MNATLDQRIAIKPDIRGGKPHIAGRRIAVQDIVIWHDRLGMSADEIASEYDLSLADIHTALAYYFSNREAIDQAIRADEQFVKELRSKTPSILEQKLKSLAVAR
jgi:uncharacterized protein (DUF433 family)